MKSNRTPYTSGRFSVKQGKEESFISAVEAVADWTMVNFQAAQEVTLLRDSSKKGGFMTIIHWDNEEAIETWRADSEFGYYMSRISAHCDSVEVFTLQRVRHFSRQ